MSETGIVQQLTSMEILSFTLLFFKLAFVVVVVWAWGYIGFSVSWLFLGVLAYVLNTKYRRRRRQQTEIGREVCKDEEKFLLRNISDLPSWVFYPDFEKAEWLNKMIKRMWPYIAMYVDNLLRDVIEPTIKDKLPEYLKGFRFVKTDLGNIAPRIGGIKVYSGDEIKRDEILMDMEIYYFGDADISFGIRTITAGIKDLEIHGTVRVSFRPLVPKVPLIGGITYAFLNPPKVNFNLTDIGNALDFPGLSSLLRGTVEDIIGDFVVLPNRLIVPLINDLDVYKLRYPIPHGVIRIHVIAAQDLKRADINLIGKGKSDPYCVMKFGRTTLKTKTVNSTVSPEWNEIFEVIADQSSGQILEIEVYDKDQGNFDDFLGRSEVSVESVLEKGRLDTWLHLEGVKTGSIHIRLQWLNLSASPGAFTDSSRKEKGKAYAQAEEDTITSDTHLHAGYLQVVVDSARNLPLQRRNEEPSAYAVVQLANEHFDSKVQAMTANPVWEEAFSFLVSNPHVDSLSVTIKDKKNNQVLGYCNFPLKLMLSEPNMTVNRPFALKDSTPTGTVQLRLALRALTTKRQTRLNKAFGASGDEEDEDLEEEEDDSLISADRAAQQLNSSFPDSSLANGSASLGPPSSPSRSEGDTGDLRQRMYAGSGMGELEGGVYQYGRLQLTLRYSQHRMCLVVVVHKACHLIACDEDGSSDPYVKLMIIPKSSHTKKKTQVFKNSLNPVFDETFDLPISQNDLAHSTLRLEMRNRLGRFSRGRKHMGFVELPLSRLDLSHAVTNWFDLQPMDGNNNQDQSSLGSNNL